MINFDIAVVVPVLNRPKNVKPFIESFLATTPLDKAEVIFVTSSSCQDEIDEIKKFSGPIRIEIASDDILSWAKRINYGISKTTQSWILCAADDVVFHQNWFELAQDASQGFSGILGTNDLGHPATIGGWHSTHPIVARDYVMSQGTMDEPGKLCHEGYNHNYVDVEMIHTAMKRGCWKHLKDCIIEHNHPAWNKNSWDDVYQKGQEKVSQDGALWQKRKAQFSL
jgi:glycosyltransferase involved in cell wall biosynthesis